MEPLIAIEHVAFYRTEIDVFFNINPETPQQDTRRIVLKRDEFPNIGNDLFQPIVQKAYSLLSQQIQEMHQAFEGKRPFDDGILWTYDLTTPASE